MSRSSSAAAVQQEPAPFPWMLTRSQLYALQDKPASAFSDDDLDLLIDLHIQRNALGIYQSLTGRGAPKTRDTLGRAFAIAKSKLAEYGYASKGGFATRKGIQKAIEKLHDEDVWEKYVAYEELLKGFRKGERRPSRGRSEFQRRLARQQLGKFREQEFTDQKPVTPQAMAKQILAQMGGKKPAAPMKSKKSAVKPAQPQTGPQAMAAKLKARLAG